ncbi:hypothetical protein EVAR_16200_1 [Eumeta japonica]|uniref:Uncharacterized protein n=1 Tax=Eumeta variegata TaxID=151549 RepID=A0A4C1U6S1_EUMVA|nr:hypothetical protein EVAR_16200_1 [Eumeta japonica]
MITAATLMVLLALGAGAPAAAFTVDLSAVDALRNELYKLEAELWRNVTDSAWKESMALGADVELTKAFQRFDERVEPIPQPHLPPLEHSWLWLKTVEKLRIIDGLYKAFVDFATRQAAPGAVPAPVREWLDLAENVLMDPTSSVPQAVQKLSNVYDMGNLFLKSVQEDGPDRCELQLSTHQVIYDMYKTVALTEIKGYAMMQFSWMLLRVYGKGNFTQEASLTRKRYDERTAKTALAARAAMASAGRDVYTCDPPHHEEGTTFAQVTRLLQGYIENEVDMNKDGTCRENCAFYTLTQRHGCYKDQFCARQPACSGRIINCQYIDSDMWICPATWNSNRRYEYIEYENGRTLGHPGSCRRGVTKVYHPFTLHISPFTNDSNIYSGVCVVNEDGVCVGGFVVALAVLALLVLHVPVRRRRPEVRPLLQHARHDGRRRQQQVSDANVTIRTPERIQNGKLMLLMFVAQSDKRKPSPSVDSWWQWWKVLHCSYCFCLCEDVAESSERFFSMREALSDVATNKVVTGLRLVKLGRIFHLQISEGSLEARGEVKPGEWVKIRQFDPNDHDTKEGVDYHTLTYENRAIDLDELDSPEGHVLTGVRFRTVGAHLHFEIHATPFNYTTGRLAAARGQWLSNDNTEGGDQPRSVLTLVRPDIPTRSKIPLKVDSKHDQYVEFTHTDLEADAAQSTVPFIDIQPVQPLKGATLASGAGLIHRGAQGSGGFIGVKLITYNYTRHVRAEPPPPHAEPQESAPEFTPIVN